MGGAVVHVELSLTEVFVPHARQPAEPDPVGPLRAWSETVSRAGEPALIINADAVIVASSASCCRLLGLGDPTTLVGCHLLDAVRLVDFTAAQDELTEPDVASIPPLLALSSGRLARGLLRVRRPGQSCTVDAIATPLRSGDIVAGSLTFFAPIA